MSLVKNLQIMNANMKNSNEAILEHIASGKKYLVHEIIHSGAENIESTINLFYDNGYSLKAVSTAGLDTKSLNRSPITLFFEKI